MIKTQRHDSILELRLDRPDKLNAMTGQMYQALADAITQANQDASVKVLLISAEGPAFCAGNDVPDFLAQSKNGLPDSITTFPPIQFLFAMADNQKPVVASVQGAAVGIGLTMLLHCDGVIAADDARLSVPFVDLGLTPEAGSSELLPKLVGPRMAAELLLGGKALNGKEAAACGLVTRSVPADQLATESRKLAERWAAKPSKALAQSRALLRPNPEALKQLILDEVKIFAERLASKEAQQAFQAFVNASRGKK